MVRYILLAFMTVALTFTTACSSKKKSGDGVAAGDVENDPSVSSQDSIYDPQGSDSGKINGLTTINFEYDRATLNSQAREGLAQNAEWIKANPNVTVQVEGHCDNRGSVEYNLALGERRAKAVKNYLVNLGIDSKRLTIISYGEEKPLVMGDTEEAFQRNRRANFVPLPN
ncbi:MAG: peptidoglycan-associated lipoprotein Pal [Bdellovibrionales bacterium]|nr:peptidoglycan-associated lipoprotein Pal [Bdellovibrionales bacterium]